MRRCKNERSDPVLHGAVRARQVLRTSGGSTASTATWPLSAARTGVRDR